MGSRTTRSLTLCSVACASIASLLTGAAVAGDDRHSNGKKITIERQGSFMFGGNMTNYSDHGYAQYQIPADARKYPLVMWHGAGNTGKAWETTPDGREGFQSIFLRRGFSVYIIDQPRLGRASKASKGRPAISDPSPTPNAGSFNLFRLGVWSPPAAPQFFPNVQFPANNAKALDQWLRLGVLHSMGGDGRDWSGDQASEAYQVTTDAVAKLMDQIGPAVLIGNSGGANQTFATAMKSANVKGIVVYEPTNFQFPEGELPPTGPLQPSHTVPLNEFLKLTKIPIQIVYGDNLTGIPLWEQAPKDAQAFVDAVNRHGGQAELLLLPKIGVFGNTHFPFLDLNNVKIADLLSKYLQKKGLDRYPRGHDDDDDDHHARR
jgi:pimeloyl-ACP methyl ester carboxylesterase